MAGEKVAPGKIDTALRLGAIRSKSPVAAWELYSFKFLHGKLEWLQRRWLYEMPSATGPWFGPGFIKGPNVNSLRLQPGRKESVERHNPATSDDFALLRHHRPMQQVRKFSLPQETKVILRKCPFQNKSLPYTNDTTVGSFLLKTEGTNQRRPDVFCP